SNQFGFRDYAFAQNSKIDSLFMKLKDEDTKNYQEIEEKIWSEWRKSGSTKSDLLLRRGMDAMSRGDFIASVEHLSAAIDYTPNFAEAWNMRATVFFLMKKYNLSVSDIQQTLKLNPRHFGALSGLGMIFERSGKPKQALEVYKKLLEVHPRSRNAIQSVNRLIKDLEGTSL
ncbi:tetratricopeptide repeat protein, partial [Amylibacter sp.]|nr:tetratricopeptide repeat protein [Amylibacter sp.]